MKDIYGIITALITPLTNHFAVDIESLKELVSYQINSGIHGLFIGGTTGEGPLLRIDERKLMAEKVLEFVSNRLPVIVHTGSESLEKTLELTKHAENIGADAVGIVLPYYYNYSQNAIFKYFKDIAEQADIPIFIYNIPSRTGNNIDVSTIKKLNREFSQIIGLKDSSKNIVYLSEVLFNLPKNFIVLVGSDALVFPGILLGCKGVISAISNVFPELLVELYKKLNTGDLSEARNMQSKILRVRKLLRKYPYISVYKTALQLRKINIDNVVKSPLRKMNDKEKSNLFNELRDLGLLN
ncbi:MAG: 4-hydroxy-tetrahydrodipicolinate synthase [Candidatus Njordarchaeales archaeon]